MLPRFLFFGFVLALAGCGPRAAPSKTEITVAAAANLTDVFGHIGPQFEAQTGIHPVFSFASTAQLAHQIENAAPYDVFTAADAVHVEELEHKGMLLPGSKAVYARGVLALWIPPNSRARIARIEDVASAGVRVVVIAKPELAPYGEAAVESLQRLGIWSEVKRKIVYAENINIAREYGASGNADAVFTAYSLVMHQSGTVMRVPEDLHSPIDQEMGIVAATKHPDAARKFAAYLLTGKGKAILADFGYQVAIR